MTNVIPLASRSAAPTSPEGARLGAPTDPIQLYAAAHNALAMALHYLRQPDANVPGAARKAVQALAALRRLNVPVEDIKPASPCAGCRDNFPLPAAADVFDGMVVDGYLARRKACAKCREGAKPCLTTGRN